LRYIEGKIRNNTAYTYAYVMVNINLYDEDDNLVGDAVDLVTNLEPGGIWRFRAPVTEENAVKYKIVQIKGSIRGGL